MQQRHSQILQLSQSHVPERFRYLVVIPERPVFPVLLWIVKEITRIAGMTNSRHNRRLETTMVKAVAWKV